MSSTPHGLLNILKNIRPFEDHCSSDCDSCCQVHVIIYWSFIPMSLKTPQKNKSRGDKLGDLGSHVTGRLCPNNLHQHCKDSMFRQVFMHMSEHLLIWYAHHW
ncbi:hypothetical protein AVEN_95266-1 [Araneus ventricosus]|uniref:Uncharacterized protein n=1 Tax=Araneus ventricosus TaxID=182803 RepID=A0A4Y2DFQ3_ARAVE|nr:hypothetical protein AVEN_95266-1 [Araneus ventricosus]